MPFIILTRASVLRPNAWVAFSNSLSPPPLLLSPGCFPPCLLSHSASERFPRTIHQLLQKVNHSLGPRPPSRREAGLVEEIFGSEPLPEQGPAQSQETGQGGGGQNSRAHTQQASMLDSKGSYPHRETLRNSVIPFQ